MTKTKTTKRALIASVLSLLVCFTMLIGSTFAWFTDSATTGVNVIKSGNLEIGFEYADGTEAIDTANWQNAEGAKIFDYEKWEPGYTVAKHIKISNKGNLALKYELDFMLNGPLGKLAEVIDVYFVDRGKQVANRTDVNGLKEVGTLKAFLEKTVANPEKGELLKGESDIVTIVLKMQETAGNAYQNQNVGDGLTVAIFATQYTYEKDSFDDQYDVNAPTLVMIGDTQYASLADAIATAEANDTIKLAGNFILPDNINNKTLTFTTTDADNKAVISIGYKNTTANGSTLTFDGITIKGHKSANKNDWYTDQLKGAVKATYKNCKIIDLITTFCPSDFIECVFENTFEDQYSVYCYSNGTFNFDSCTFNTACSKAIKVYDEGNIAGEKTVNVKNCTFKAAASKKAAVEIDSTRRADKGDYLVNISNCTINENYSSVYNLEGTYAKVTIDGKTAIAEGLLYDDVSTYTVTSAEGMFNFAKQVNESANSFSGKTVVLANDIDLENKAWTPIGQTGATQFLGTFDGNSHTIKNLKIDSSAQTGGSYSSGLFGWIERHGEDAGYLMAVKNLTIDNANVKGNHNVAVIAGYLIGTIDNCHVKNAIVVCNHANENACGDKAGVIAGIAAEAKALIKDCTAADSTVTAGRDAGQIVGACIVGKVENCKATNVTVSATGDCNGNNISNAIIGRTN